MRTEDAVKFYGSQAALARALEVSRQYVNQWGKAVPLQIAFQLQDLSKGKLQMVPKLYRKAKRA